MRITLGTLLAGLMLFVAVSLADNFSLDEVLSFTVPGVTNISDYCLNDIDYDGTPEILVLTGDTLLLYSASLDSILFEKL